ncbi:MAG: ATPase, T2SS/T4P/T4SS family [Granulosicoccaceae bacterium]
MAPSSTNNLAVAPLQETTRELDLSLLLQGASVEQKVGWELLSQLLRQALEYRCDQITIEPEHSCWRTRFFAADKNVEHIEHDVASLLQLANNLSSELIRSSDESGRLHSVLAWVGKQRYLMIFTQLPGVDGVIFSVTIEPWQPMPSSFNELRLPSTLDRRIRHWLSAKGGWLAVAGPSSKLNVRGQLALLQAVSAPESRILHVAQDQRYSLPRINQIALRDIKEPQRDMVWQHALATPFDAFVLDGVRDEWLQSLANISAPEATVIHTVSANSTSFALRRLQALQLNQSRFAQGRTAILLQYPVRLQCEHCKCVDNNTQTHHSWLNDWLEPDDTIEAWINPRYRGFMTAPGCERCHDTGLADWTTIYEWLEFNADIKTAIQDDSWQTAQSLLQLQQTVVQSVFKLARQGSISLTEAKRLLGLVSH